MNKIIPYIMESNSICPKCKNKSIVLLDAYGNKIKIDNYDDSKYILKEAKCESCKATFELEWFDGKPRLSRDSYSKTFFVKNNFEER